MNIEHNIKQVIKEFDRLKQNTIKAEVSANKKIAQQTRTQVIREARSRYNFKASDMKDAVVVRHGNSNSPTSQLKFSTKRTPLFNFGAKQTKPGVSVMVKKGRRVVINGSFIPELKSSFKGVFVRKRIGGKRVPRLPIKKLFGLSPAQMMFNRNAQITAMKFIKDKWDTIFTHELEYYHRK